MIRKLKRERTALIVCLILSMLLHLAYGLEGIKQIEALELQNSRQAAQLQDKQEQIEVLEIMLEHQEEPELEESEPTETHLGEFEITYYCPCTACCGKTDGITASGTLAIEGQTVAADWEVLAPGTEIYIDGIGFRTVEDKGGAINGNKLDVYMDSHIAALDAGRHMANVIVVEDNYDEET